MRNNLLFRDEYWLDHESWVRYCFDCLGDVRGKQVLDYGCRTPDERPLRYRDIHSLARPFKDVRVREFQFLSMISRVAGGRPFGKTIERFDEVLFNAFPWLRRFSRYIVIELRKSD